MKLDGATIARLTKPLQLRSYVRVIPKEFCSTPLGVGPSVSRFCSPRNDFLVLYAGRNLTTALAETVVRDRFEGSNTRRLFIEELQDRCAVQVSTKSPLRLLDIRKGGCLKLGISTDVTGAKAQDEARAFSQYVHDETDIAGIFYASRLTGENCVVVFDRAIEDHLVVERVVAMEQMKSLETALASLRIELIS